MGKRPVVRNEISIPVESIPFKKNRESFNMISLTKLAKNRQIKTVSESFVIVLL